MGSDLLGFSFFPEDMEKEDEEKGFRFDESQFSVDAMDNHNAMSVLKHSLDKNPDQEAKIESLSSKSGIPSPLVAADPDAVERRVRENEIPSLLKESPETSRFLSMSNNARMAHDNIENMSVIEKAFNSTLRGVDMLQGMAYGTAEFLGEATGIDSLDEFGREGRESNRLEAAQYGEKKQFTDIETFGDLVTWMVETGGEQSVMMAPGMAGAIAGGKLGMLAGPYAPIAVPLGAFIGSLIPSLILGIGETQGALKEKDPDAVATGEVLMAGGLIALLDSVLPGKLGGKIATSFGKKVGTEAAEEAVKRTMLNTAKKISKQSVKGASIEGITESIQEAISETAASIGADQEIDTENLSSSMVEAFAAGFFMGGGSTTVTEAYAHQQQSKADAKKIENITKAVENDKLRERNPEKFKEYIEGLGEKYETENINIDPEGAEEYLQSQEWSEELAENPTVQKIMGEIQKAKNEGRMIEVPIKDFVVDIVGSEIQEGLAKHSKVDINSMTPHEVENTDFDALYGKMKERETEDNIAEAEISYDLVNDLVKAGVEPHTAESNVKLALSGLKAQAERTGLTVQELYDKAPLKVRPEIDEVTRKKLGAIEQLDIELERLRTGDIPQDKDIYGQSALDFIKEKGGVLARHSQEVPDVDLNKRGKNKPKKLRIFQEEGMDLDVLAERLVVEGYLTEADPQAVLDIIEGSTRDEHTYRTEPAKPELQEAKANLDYLTSVLEEAGLDVQSMSNEEIKSRLSGPESGVTLYQQQSPISRNALGLYSGAVRVVTEMSFPGWKKNKKAKRVFTQEMYKRKQELEGQLEQMWKRYYDAAEKAESHIPALIPKEDQIYVKSTPEWAEYKELEAVESKQNDIDDPKATGESIWQKIQSEKRIAQEVKWIGLEEYLTVTNTKGVAIARATVEVQEMERRLKAAEIPANGYTEAQASQYKYDLELSKKELAEIENKSFPNKFSRADVLNFIEQNGVQLQENVGTEISDGEGELHFDEGEVDDDSANWEHLVEGYMYDFAHNESDYWFNQQEWLHDNIDKVVENYETSLPADAKEEIAALREPYTESVTTHSQAVLDILHSNGYDVLEDMRGTMRPEAEEKAETTAEEEYMDDPYITYQDQGDSGLRIYGRDSEGWSVRTGYSHHEIIADNISNYNDAEVQARTYAYENDLLRDENSADVARWHGYMEDMDNDNYREMKLTLPGNKGRSFFDEHFPDANDDENLFAFLRVADAELYTGEVQEAPEPVDFHYEVTQEEGYQRLFKVYNTATGDLLHNQFIPDHISEERLNEVLENTRKEGQGIGSGYKVHSEGKLIKEAEDAPALNTFYLGELQSGWHQKGSQAGYVQPEEKFSINDIRGQYDKAQGKFITSANVSEEDRATIERARQMISDLSVNSRIPDFVNQYEYFADAFKALVHWKINYTGVVGKRRNREITEIKKMVRGVYNKTEEGRELYRLIGERIRLEEGIPVAPYEGEGWITLGLKRALVEAVNQNYEAFAWPDTEVLVSRWSEEFRKAYETQYSQRMPSIIKKLTGQKPKHLSFDEDNKVIEPLSPEEIANQESMPSEVYSIEKIEGDMIRELEDENGNYPDYGFMDINGEWEHDLGGQVVGYDTKVDAINELDARDERWWADQPTKEKGYFLIELTDELKKQIREESFTYMQKDKVKRGSFNTGNQTITLTPDANLSTFVHELGHYFFDMLQTLAPQSKEVRDDLQKLNTWFAANGAESDVARHEMLASGMEQYMMEGKAPTNELKSLFYQFKTWLTFTYEKLVGKNPTNPFAANQMEGVELSDEVRGVMDRIIASKSAIEQAKTEMFYDIMPILEMGLKPKDSEQYKELQNEAKEKANADLTAKLTKSLQAQKDKWWKKEQQERADRYRKDLEDRPEYKARDYLSGYRVPEGMERFKLDSTYIKQQYGEAAGKKLGTMSNKSGHHPDKVAVFLGFKSGDELVRSLMNTMNVADRKASTQQEAKADMEAEYGTMGLDGSIVDEAQKAIHNDKQSQLLAMELKFLNQKLSDDGIWLEEGSWERRKKGSEFASKGTPKDVRGIYKASAERAVAQAPIDTLRPDVYRRNEQKHGREAFKFAGEQKWAEARKAKHKQLFQFYMYRQATKAKEQAGKIQKRLKKMQTGKYSARSVHPDYIQSLKVLLAAYDVRKNPIKSQELLDNVNSFIEAQHDSNKDLIAGGLLDSITSWKKMSLDELQSLKDAAENILHTGKMLGEDGKTAFKEMVKELTVSVQSKMVSEKKTIDNRSALQSFESFFNVATAAHRKLESLVQELDGWQDDGPVYDAVFRQLWEAQLAELDRGGKEHAFMDELFRDYNYLFSGMRDVAQGLEVTKRFAGDLHEVTVNGNKTRSLSREQRITLALNWGNEGNREAVRNQKKYSMTDEDVMAALETLTESELQLVNKIWEYVDSFWGELSKVEQKATGIVPRKVKPDPFMVNGVQMRGGYYPLAADSSLSFKAETKTIEEKAEKVRKGGAGRASTKHGSLNERTKFGGQVVNLSLDTLFKHVDGIIHDITHREAVMDVEGILNNSKFSEAAQESIGSAEFRALKDSIVRVAGGAEHPSDITGLNKYADWSRVAGSFGAMGYSVRTALINITGFAPAIPEVGVIPLMSAMMDQMSHPVDFGAKIKALSVFMEHRGETITRDVFHILKNMRGHKGWNFAKEHAFWMMVKVDAFVSRSVWKAAYQNAISEKKTESEAVEWADRTVSRTQGTGMKIDQSAIEDTNHFVKALTPMYTYFNAILALSKRRAGKYKTGQIKGHQMFTDMLWIFVVPAFLEEIMMGGSDDEDEEGIDTAKRYGKSLASYYAGQWFGVREMSAYIKYGRTFEPLLFKGVTAPANALNELYEMGFDEDWELDKQSVKAGTDLLPYLGFPTGLQVNRIGKFMLDLEESGEDLSIIGAWDMMFKGQYKER